MTDNAQNFIKGKSTIQSMFDRLNNAKMHQRLGEELKIRWYHSISRSPSHNGQVEAAVKIIKKPLYNSQGHNLFELLEKITHVCYYRLLLELSSPSS